MQRGKNEMAGFGRLHRDFDRFTVAHFADEDNFGRLAQGGAQSQSKGGSVAIKLALMDGGFFVIVAKLDGIFDAQDMNGAFTVGAIDDRGQRGRFAGTGRAGDQNDSVAQMHDFRELRRKLEIVKAGNRRWESRA